MEKHNKKKKKVTERTIIMKCRISKGGKKKKKKKILWAAREKRQITYQGNGDRLSAPWQRVSRRGTARSSQQQWPCRCRLSGSRTATGTPSIPHPLQSNDTGGHSSHQGTESVSSPTEAGWALVTVPAHTPGRHKAIWLLSPGHSKAIQGLHLLLHL